MSEIIKAEHLGFTYPGVDDAPGAVVFEDMNLTIEEGSLVAILGSNGCGKSTLAKHFNAILLPCGGKVWVCGMDTADENRLISIRRNVGMVFQNPDNQIVANVVEEDVAFGPENLGIASPEIRHRVDKALDALEADHDYLTAGGVFPEELIKNFIARKRKECSELSKIPHPAEFDRYFNL